MEMATGSERNTLEPPVLIVGSGPVGLALALDPGWRGVACTLVERTGEEWDVVRVTGIATCVPQRTMQEHTRPLTRVCQCQSPFSVTKANQNSFARE